MRIAKYGHSCLLVETASGTRILVDPGSFSAVPDEVITGHLDAVLITHSHPDHLDESLLGRIEAAHPGISIFGSNDIVALLAEKGIGATDHAFTDFAVEDARIEVLQAGHDAVLVPVPNNAAYRINEDLVITGDSTAVALDRWKETRVLALVTIAPWGSHPMLAALIDRIKPQIVFPMHDGFVKDAFLARQNAAFSGYAEQRGVRYLLLRPELIEV